MTMSKPRLLTVAAAQLGPVTSLTTPRTETLSRMIRLLEQAAEKKVQLVLFPELAFTTFFPSYIIDDPDELAGFFEPASPSDPYAVVNSPNAKPLIDKAEELGVDVSFGYAERWTGDDGKVTDFNTALYYSASQKTCVAKYRKVHLPGRREPDTRPGVTQQLEKRYFTPGDLGFHAFRAGGLLEGAVKAQDTENPTESEGKGDPIIGMLICNDRRWAEAWRCYGLQGIELILVSHPSGSLSWEMIRLPDHRRATTPLRLHLSTTARMRRKRRRPSSTTASHARQGATRMPATAFMPPRLGRRTTGLS